MIPWTLTFASAFLLVIPSVLAQQLCNGYAEFCNRSYGNVTFIGAHDSAFVSPTEALTANQHFDVTTQLNDGIRMLQSQGHKKNGATDIELCHTDCDLLDAGTLLSYLQKVKSWLDQNPDEDIETWAGDFASAGIADLAFVPTFTTTPGDTLDWPTLGSMISSGKRVVIFLDAGANPAKVNYILPEFTYMWETPFDQTDPSFPCTVDRPSTIAGQFPTGRLSVINHFLDTTLTAGVLIPDIAALNVTNAVSGAGSLGVQINSCAAFLGRYPNFLLVDCNNLPKFFVLTEDYDVKNGSVFEVAATANGVPYHASADVLKNSNKTSATVHGIPTSAAAKKVLPVFVIMQVALSGLTIAGAFWLAWGDDTSKYNRLEDRSTNFIPALSKGHQKYASIASVTSDAGFAVELERGGRMLRGDGRTDSVTDLASSGALMGVHSERGSMDSEHSDEDEGDEASLRRMLHNPVPQRGFLENRRDSLHLS